MNKKLILIISFTILFLVAYFCYKGINLSFFNTEDFEQAVKENFKIRGTITLKHKNIQDNDYFQYKNIKIRNDFKDFEQIELSSENLSLRKKTNNRIKAFLINIEDNYVYLLKSNKILYGNYDSNIININLIKFLDKNNINNDVELINYLSNHKNVRNNIFTSVRKMKENYAILMIPILLPVMDITLINGDYEGYVFNYKNNENTKKVSILKNDKRYEFTFMDNEGITNEYLIDILSTIIIE